MRASSCHRLPAGRAFPSGEGGAARRAVTDEGSRLVCVPPRGDGGLDLIRPVGALGTFPLRVEGYPSGDAEPKAFPSGEGAPGRTLGRMRASSFGVRIATPAFGLVRNDRYVR